MAQILLFSDCNGSLGLSRYSGPYRIATELRNNGFNVQVVDFFTNYTLDQLEKICRTHIDSNTLFVGFAATLWTKKMSDKDVIESLKNQNVSMRSFYKGLYVSVFPQSEDFIKGLFTLIKGINPNIKLVVGGQKANAFYKCGVDYWIIGQGEGPVVALANHLKDGLNLKYVDTPYGNIITDTLYPCHNFSESQIKFTGTDFIFPGENLPIETARGCIFKCSFCAFNLNGKKFMDYTKSKDTLIEELTYNWENHGINEYMISDDTFNDSMTKMEYFHSVITSLPFKIKFSCHARLDIIGTNMEMAYMLKEMGLVCAEFGIETMNKETGKYIGKLGDREKIIKILHDIKDVWKDDVYMSSGFIVGLPYETEDSIRQTMAWLESSDNPLTAVQFNQFYHINPRYLPHNFADKQSMRDAGFNESIHGWTLEPMSKISLNPEKYGYNNDRKKWSTKYIDIQTAERLEEEFHLSPGCRQKKNLAVYHNYNRIRNLGYSHEKIKNLYHDDFEFVAEAIQKKSILINNYLQKII